MRCLQQKPVMTYDPEVRGMVQAVDADGNGVWQFDSMGANKALELLGKYKAMWTDRLKVDEGSALTLLREKLNADPK